MLYVGLDLSRKRLDWLALEEDGQLAANVYGKLGLRSRTELVRAMAAR